MCFGFLRAPHFRPRLAPLTASAQILALLWAGREASRARRGKLRGKKRLFGRWVVVVMVAWLGVRKRLLVGRHGKRGQRVAVDVDGGHIGGDA